MLQPGARLGRYEIRSLIGAGGMGEVYLAHDAHLQRPVALKLLGAAVRSEELRRRLEHEARAASALNHPNILTVYDVGRIGEDDFIATEFVDGVTLRQRLLRAEPSIEEIVDLGTQLASALSAAEEAGLIHRDVKPDNIMIRRDGLIKLLDFGLARGNDLSEPSVEKTDPYVVRGTVFYMSPEQLRGRPLDSRTDIWSCGVVLFELISGRLPFTGATSSDVVSAILRSDPEPLTRASGAPVPPRLAAIVDRAMSKERTQRQATTRELLDELRSLRTDLQKNAATVVGSAAWSGATTEEVAIESLPATNLPGKLTSLVGRDAERADLTALLRRPDVRLVTLTGPGGTGKTRLSLAAGADLLRQFEDGVWWASMSSIRDPRLVPSAIAAVLEIQEGGVPLIDALKNALRDKQLLLVLDNFEQVLEAADAVGQLLAAAPMVKAIVTSRAPLHIEGEREYAVPPLPTPPIDLPLTPEALEQYPSVALFVQRAAAVKSDFRMTAENANAIAEICVRLDGLPLAIELAAARVKVLPPQAMLARVDDRLKLLSGGPRDLPERQQTMRAAISWGYNLLDEPDRSLFATLSVFRGGFSIEEAERLARTDALDGISSLLDKAFLRRDPASSDDDPRFTMLGTIRDYGMECLAAEKRLNETRLAHAQLMAALAEEHELETDRLAANADNFRSAIDWACAAGDAELALRLGGALWWSWYVRGNYSEGRRSLDAILAVPGGGDVPIRTKAESGAGALAFLQCDYDRSIELLDSSIALSRRHGDPVSLARSLQFRGSIARERGDYEQAIDLHLLSKTLWTELEDKANVGRSMNYVGFASWLNRDFKRTRELCETTLQLFRDRRDVEGVAWSLLNLAAASLYSGDAGQAEEWLDECLSWSRSGGYKEGVAWSLNLLGYVWRARGDEWRAETILQDSLRLHWEMGDRWRSASVLEALGGLRRDPRLLGAAAILREKLKTPVPPVERAQYEADLAHVGSSPFDVAEAVEAAL